MKLRCSMTAVLSSGPLAGGVWSEKGRLPAGYVCGAGPEERETRLSCLPDRSRETRIGGGSDLARRVRSGNRNAAQNRGFGEEPECMKTRRLPRSPGRAQVFRDCCLNALGLAPETS